MSAPGMNQHEQDRQDRIASNRAKMEELGLFQVLPEQKLAV